MTAPKDRLPTKAQLDAITDLDAIKAICDELELHITRISTDLEFRVEDEAWASRARGALAAHRHARTLAGRRLEQLKSTTTKKAERRPDEECSPLTLEVLADRPVIQAETLNTIAAVDQALASLAERIDAVTVDRIDEIGRQAAVRDEAFLAATDQVLRLMRGQRQALQNRRGEISREIKRAKATAPVLQKREQLFIDACREILDRPTYLAIWERVDQMEKVA